MKTALKNGPPPDRMSAHVSPSPEGVTQDTDRITYQMPNVKGGEKKVEDRKSVV